MAEWLGIGLQNRAQQFDSAWYLHSTPRLQYEPRRFSFAATSFFVTFVLDMAQHNAVGKWGEDIACDALLVEGATIRERNWRCGHYEIDIVATKGDELIFAEVKTRSSDFGDPLDAVDSRKISRMVRAAEAYLRSTDIEGIACRFDLFGITGTPGDYTVEHIPDAFYPPLRRYR